MDIIKGHYKSIPRLVEVAFIAATLFLYYYWNRGPRKDADVEAAVNDKNLKTLLPFLMANIRFLYRIPRKRTIMYQQFWYEVLRRVPRYVRICQPVQFSY